MMVEESKRQWDHSSLKEITHPMSGREKKFIWNPIHGFTVTLTKNNKVAAYEQQHYQQYFNIKYCKKLTAKNHNNKFKSYIINF